MATRSLFLLLLTLVLGAAGCRAASPEEPAALEDVTAGPSAQENEVSETTASPYANIPAAQSAREAYAAEMAVDAAAVRIVDVEEVTWRDSSLGCARKGESYLQVLTPGYRITVTTGDEYATYHSDRGAAGRAPNLVRCGAPALSDPLQPVTVPEVSLLVAPALDKARADLQARIGAEPSIALDEVTVADVTELECDDGAGQRPSSRGPAKVIFELRLRVGQDVHIYRAWTDEVIYCGLAEGPAVE